MVHFRQRRHFRSALIGSGVNQSKRGCGAHKRPWCRWKQHRPFVSAKGKVPKVKEHELELKHETLPAETVELVSVEVFPSLQTKEV